MEIGDRATALKEYYRRANNREMEIVTTEPMTPRLLKPLRCLTYAVRGSVPSGKGS
jgi:hypothetical protein